MLFDEPVNHLDWHHQILIMDHLARLTREGGKTALVSLHDPNLAARYCAHVLLLGPDGAAEWGPRPSCSPPSASAGSIAIPSPASTTAASACSCRVRHGPIDGAPESRFGQQPGIFRRREREPVSSDLSEFTEFISCG